MSKFSKYLKQITLLSLLIVLGSAGACSKDKNSAKSTNTTEVEPQGKHNVILISVDTLRADRLGCYGYKKRDASPFVDEFAKDSVLFENFISSAPWTTPAHLSMLTGLHPSTHGLTKSFGEMWSGLFYNKKQFFKLPESRVTLAEVLKENGYDTVAFTAGGPVEPSIGLGQGFDMYDTSMFKLYDENVGEMEKWIAEHDKKKPFFLFWHHFEVHAPYLHSDYLGEILSESTTKEVRESLEAIRKIPLKTVWPGGASSQRTKQVKVLKDHEAFNGKVCEALYVAGVKSADKWFGRLVAYLKKLNLYDNTMIVFTSDHGEEFQDRSKNVFYNIHGHTLYDEMIRVPLIIKFPKSYKKGLRAKQIASTVDLMPTILDFLKLKPKVNEMQGESLRPYWEKPGSTPNRVAYTEAMARKNEKKSLRTKNYKYILSIDAQTVQEKGRQYIPEKPQRVELYNLEKDPNERHNLLRDHPGKLTQKVSSTFDKQLRDHIKKQTSKVEKTELDDATLNKLKSLGYIGE